MSQAAVTAYVGIGSNLDGPAERVRRAARSLSSIPDTRLEALSSWYLTPPLGPADQPDYINGVAVLATALPPIALFESLRAIELRQGRRRGTRWGPRTLDLDLLVYGDVELDGPDLILPHPRMAERAFVLVPLAEVAPDALIPGLGVVMVLRDALPADSLRAIRPEPVAP